MKRKRYWRILIILVAVILVGITFTPLILSPGQIDPKLFSLPYTLWTSMIITVVLVLLSFTFSFLFLYLPKDFVP